MRSQTFKKTFPHFDQYLKTKLIWEDHTFVVNSESSRLTNKNHHNCVTINHYYF